LNRYRLDLALWTGGNGADRADAAPAKVRDFQMVRKPTTPIETDDEAAETPLMKKPELLDAVVSRTNLKKRDVKPAVEAAFAVIAEALRDGTDLSMPPLGKVRVVKSKDIGDGAAVLTLKLRTPKNATVVAVSELAQDDADE
jgi:hypothetical protein